METEIQEISKEDWLKIDRFIKKRDSHKCRKCGNKKKLSVHHIKPRNQCGSYDQRNLITLCEDCHNYCELNGFNWLDMNKFPFVKDKEEELKNDLIEPVTELNKQAFLENHTLCEGCGKVFKPYSKIQRFHSDLCRITYNKKHKSYYKKKPIVERICVNCLHPFKTRYSKQRFCSTNCCNEYQLKKLVPKRKLICAYCKEPFETSHAIKKYCSTNCRLLSRKERLKIELS
jgi:hypothetical protein